QDATGFVLNGEGYIGTGNDNEGSQNFDDFWRYDFDNDVWVEIDDFGGMGRRYMVSFVIGNVAYCGTGTNGTNLRDFWAFYPLLTAEKLTAESTLVFYPNPAQEFIIVPALNSGTFVHYKIYDLNGNIVASSLINKENKIYTSQLSDGIYFIQLTDSMNRNFTGKISKVTE
ncbi:MAG: T9SS type A sorting domain-containing protein, partial [Crocinitomicaceae bacterium]|nr:T9SS type A sorting domain-containing protein [Crocinitomicaceae bacterium]